MKSILSRRLCIFLLFYKIFCHFIIELLYYPIFNQTSLRAILLGMLLYTF